MARLLPPASEVFDELRVAVSRDSGRASAGRPLPGTVRQGPCKAQSQRPWHWFAASQPEKLKELPEVFIAEADRHQVSPARQLGAAVPAEPWSDRHRRP
ncbi:MAG: hypothetical protein HT579_15160 [Candidatus Accumulibacter similis]|nr:MAG: hypothetical protein HT579_15160 [Candidatus Accumulibacter similis]